MHYYSNSTAPLTVSYEQPQKPSLHETWAEGSLSTTIMSWLIDANVIPKNISEEGFLSSPNNLTDLMLREMSREITQLYAPSCRAVGQGAISADFKSYGQIVDALQMALKQQYGIKFL